MTERKLERSERKSHEGVIKWDDNPLISPELCSCTHSAGITERECCTENLTNSAELKSNIFSDNCCVKKTVNEEKSDEIDREYTKTEIMSMSAENSDCSNKECIKITNQNIEGKQQITMDNKKCTEFSFSLKEIDIAATDFNIFPENKTENSAQNIAYINKSIRFTRVYDNTCTCNLSKSKSHPLEITIQKDENDTDTLSAIFSCSSDNIINLPKLESEVIKGAIPVYENTSESMSSESDKDILSAKFSCSSHDIISLPKLESEVIKGAIPVYKNSPESTSSETERDKDVLSEKFSCSSDDIIILPKLESEVITDAVPIYENTSESISSESDKDILPAKCSCFSDDIIILPKLESEVIKGAIPVYENRPESTSSETECDKDVLSEKFSSSDDIINLPKLESEVIKGAIPVYENSPESTSSESDKDILSAKFSCSFDEITNLPKLENKVIKDAIPVYGNTLESTSSETECVKDILSAKFSCSSDDIINLAKLESEVIKDVIPVYENLPECTSSENDKVILFSNVSCSSNEILNIQQSESGAIKLLIPNSENIIDSTSPSANQYQCNLDKTTESVNVIQNILKITTEEKINENEKSFSSIEKDNLSRCIYAGEKKKYENTEQHFSENNRDHDIATDFQINSGVSDSDIKMLLRYENDELKYRAVTTEKVLEEEFPLDLDYTDITKSSIIENGLKDTMIQEQSTEYQGLLYPEDVTYLLASKHKIIKEKSKATEGIVPTEVVVNENPATAIDYYRLQHDHCSTDKLTCKRKVDKNTLNVLHEECDKSFDSYTYGSNTSFHIKEKMNSEKIIYDHTNYKKDFCYVDSGDSVGENLISDNANNSKTFYSIDSSDLASINILKSESEFNTTDNVVQTKQKFDKSKFCDSSYYCHNKFYRMEIEKESHKIAHAKDEGLYYSSDCTKSRTDKQELGMAANKETESIVLHDEDSWEDLSDYITIDNKEGQDTQHKVKTEVIGKACECEKSNDGLLCNEDSEYCEAACYLTDKNKSFETTDNFYTSWQETFSNGVSCLTNLNIIRNYTKYISRIRNKTTTEETETNRNDEDTTFTDYRNSSKKVREISNDKCNSAKHVDTRETLISQSCESRSQNIKTLEDALNYFKLSTLMEELEISLEEVRRRRKTKEAHELFLKDVDKQIQKLSFKYHPDRVRNKGGSEEEIEIAQKLQAAINAIRSALNVLNDAFLEDLDTDHRYGFYMKLELSSLANEKEVKSHIYEVIFQIGLLSEIKQQKVIAEIQKFLKESQCCVQSYFAHNICDFEKHRDLALLHLKFCIKGYKKLKSELEAIEKEYKAEKLDNISCSISRMVIENEKMLTVLRELKGVAKKSLAGPFQIFTTSETLDEYFMLPFVCYVNVILMCNVMIQSELGRFRNYVLKSSHMDSQTFKINGHISFVLLYSLVLYFIDNGQSEWLIKENMSKKESKEEFDKYLVCFTSHFKNTFKVCDYKYGSMRNYISEELKKCTKMMFDFKVKERELSENLEKFKKKTEEIDKKYERIMKENEELNKITQQQIENSKKLSELTSLATSEKF